MSGLVARDHAASAESGLEWLLEWEQLRPFVPSGGGHGRALDLGCGRSVAPARLPEAREEWPLA